jgi:hypothetical protein
MNLATGGTRPHPGGGSAEDPAVPVSGTRRLRPGEIPLPRMY